MSEPLNRETSAEALADVSSLLHDLAIGSRRLADLDGRVDVAALVQQDLLRVVHGVLGPVVTLGAAGRASCQLANLRPLAASTATDEVALREATLMAVARGYTVTLVGSRSLRLNDQDGREHVLYIRVSSGPPSTKWVATLIRRHRSTLRLHSSTLILVVTRPENYARQVQYQRHLQVWALQ
ncbi:hypothetical protein [Deinococcus xianganensis]|uniref:Uncharacterized protein n=1 Tax=Deinococcus xianganensis TaxID=1507289 RepID=A0A6I4YGP8_9DEIO|nr:hypothetical protein [Deinococcus xianganensis]MXV19211.1 hypothetical protein [Deinococcus xianganensis]